MFGQLNKFAAELPFATSGRASGAGSRKVQRKGLDARFLAADLGGAMSLQGRQRYDRLGRFGAADGAGAVAGDRLVAGVAEQTFATEMGGSLNSRGTRLVKGAGCLLLMLAYGYGFRQWIAPVLTAAMSGYPVFAQKVGLILALMPIWLLATYIAVRLLPRPNAPTRQSDR